MHCESQIITAAPSGSRTADRKIVYQRKEARCCPLALLLLSAFSAYVFATKDVEAMSPVEAGGESVSRRQGTS